MMDSLTENKEAPWHMMFADDVVLCAREKDVGLLELQLDQVGGGHVEERNESVKSKYRVHVSEWNAIMKC